MGDADTPPSHWTVRGAAAPGEPGAAARRAARARAGRRGLCTRGHGAPARRRAPGGPRTMTQRGPRLGGPGGANRHILNCEYRLPPAARSA